MLVVSVCILVAVLLFGMRVVFLGATSRSLQMTKEMHFFIDSERDYPPYSSCSDFSLCQKFLTGITN